MNSDAKREDAAQTKTEDSASIEGDTTAKFKKGRKSTESLARVEESTQIGTKDSDPKKANTTKDKNLEETTATDKVSATEGEDTNKTTNNDAKNSTESTNKEAPQTGEKGSSLTMPDVKQWFEAFYGGDMTGILYLLREGDVDVIKNNINSDGNSIFHVAVAIGRNNLIKKILSDIDAGDLTEIKNKKGSTVLHIAAIVGNSYAADLLLNKNINLLHIKDNFGKKPLLKAYENMRLETAYLLLKATIGEKIRIKNAPIDDQNNPLKSNHVADGGKNAPTVHQNSPLKSNIPDEDFSTGIGVLVQAISAKRYGVGSTKKGFLPKKSKKQ
ncbi:hypothetical protein E3N88_26537 [Mikania micrantha]|uniref:Uncharacterized protein n=1 Tax=Mikania micrantha TaxID=192012 RepID=A0A5N6MUY8_9ASTR|nr:hypothetical protein E3N88_26537 [Mikania micrantha]